MIDGCAHWRRADWTGGPGLGPKGRRPLCSECREGLPGAGETALPKRLVTGRDVSVPRRIGWAGPAMASAWAPPGSASMAGRPDRCGIVGRVRLGLCLGSVMVAGCEDDDLCLGDDIDEAMLVV